MAEEATSLERARANRLSMARLPRQPRQPIDTFEQDVLDPLEEAVNFSARPVDVAMIERLGSMHLTDDEIAKVIDIPIEQFTTLYAQISERGRQTGIVALHRVAWRMAMRGNTTMVLHLREQVLGERKPALLSINANIDLSAEDPRSVLLAAISEAAQRLGSLKHKSLPGVEIAAEDNEF